MKTWIPKDMSPFKMVYYAFRFFGFMNYEDRPWSVIYTSSQWFIINIFGIASLLGVFLGNDLIGALSGFAVYMMTIPKLLNFMFKQKEIRDILMRLENIRTEMLRDKENVKTIKEAERDGRRLITLLCVIVISAPVLTFIRTAIEEYHAHFKIKSFHHPIWVPWSLDGVWPYLATKALVTVMVESLIAANASFAFLQFTFAYQISAYLIVLKNYFETKGPADELIYEVHKSLLNLVKDYNNIFSGQMYFETIIAPLIPCGFGLLAIRELRKKGSIQFESYQKVFSAILPPFIVCACGQKIITQVESLHEASYMCKWYEEKPRVRKDLLMLMIRTINPTTINYRLFVTLDHECLAKVLQGLYSFFMLAINFDMT